MSKRKDSASWKDAKKCADSGELAIGNALRNRGWDVLRTIGKADVDLVIQAGVEVKTDRQASRTGNFAIEVSHHGKPSGLATSPARFWAFVMGTEGLIVETSHLRRLVFENDWPERDAGDDGASRVRLVPVEKIRNIKDAKVVSLAESSP